MLTPAGRHVTLTVRRHRRRQRAAARGPHDHAAARRSAFGQREDALDFLSYAPGATDAQVQPAVDRLLASAIPAGPLAHRRAVQAGPGRQINQLLTLIYVLLALSVIVSLFGIVNTLILSIYERTRELGMMRAIGTSRRQIRQMIRYESVITALIGGVFGSRDRRRRGGARGRVRAVGSGYVIAIPVGTLILLLWSPRLAGVIAAQLPARRAARLDLLQALASE